MGTDVTPQQAFDRYHQAVFSFAYRLTGRQDLAEDLTQECFLVLLRAPDRFDESRATMKTYLFSIARNLALKNYRDHRVEEPLDDLERAASAPIEVTCAVAEAIAGLPELQKEAVVLFEYERFTLEEIAQIVGADTGTVKSRLHRARERLRRVLAPYRRVRNDHGTVVG